MNRVLWRNVAACGCSWTMEAITFCREHRAASDLLAALKALYEAQKYVEYHLGIQVRAAIAKAEGV